MTATTRGHRGNRHGRSEDARRSILEAADDLLVEQGFARLTMEGIAQRAGVAKQTIYRWWPSKTAVLLEAFIEDAADMRTPVDTGNLAEDLRAHARTLATFLTHSDAGAVFRALIAEAQHDKELSVRLRREHLIAQRRHDRGPLERAMARGDLPKDVDIEMAVDRLVGPIYYRVLVTGQPVPPRFIDALVAGVVESLIRRPTR